MVWLLTADKQALIQMAIIITFEIIKIQISLFYGLFASLFYYKQTNSSALVSLARVLLTPNALRCLTLSPTSGKEGEPHYFFTLFPPQAKRGSAAKQRRGESNAKQVNKRTTVAGARVSRVQ
ncbi:hypothetical protein KXQ82_00635 [Mucilaginibacter sp. HMF5004]|uniref:hypothetical protein n=1 Tax=Mucilaginibacter rivuli TaxID=2857527 RepID=UPI001C5FF204|nr:hypothetical protein [Mucilaginibacter rivuli]MBW4888193.1 hypothetical protein [Mucilaginibacter rivuli]